MSHSTSTQEGASHGSLRSYVIGFVLSVILTVIPFAMVMDGSVVHRTIFAVVIVSAVVQIIVHFIYFLHMNRSSEERWNLVALLFTIMIIAIIVVGSLWIMHHLDLNMMIE